MEQSPGSENWWVYWNHIRYFLLCLFLCERASYLEVAPGRRKKDAAFIERVKGFLSAGLSDSPKNIFAKLGIDITDNAFWDRGLDEVEKLLDETTRLAERMGKIKAVQ